MSFKILFVLIFFAYFKAQSETGALIKVSLNGNAGVLLDEFPQDMQDRVALDLIRKNNGFWRIRAQEQVETTLYRLIYRNFYYANRGRLPLPPKEVWKIQISQPKIQMIGSHRYVAASYKMTSTLLTSADSVVNSEPALVNIGGVWNEPFVLPVDPELLLERTGLVCMNETGFPPNSVDSENARNFFDSTKESCVATLEKNVGTISTGVRFERIAWDPHLANKVRVGAVKPGGADVEVLASGLSNHRIIYRYIEPNSCAIAEGCVKGSGWRRLLQFDASVANRSQIPIALGEISEASELVRQNMFEFSACHGHYHFSHYGLFSFGKNQTAVTSKKAFCLESTSRYSNNETTPLNHPYTCHNQGIEAGWGDDYIAGVECQWLDVTDVAAPIKDSLGFRFNPDQFICEGRPDLDEQGNFRFVPTSFRTPTGEVQNRIACHFSDRYEENNFNSRQVEISKQGSYVTRPCRVTSESPLRNCGFNQFENLKACLPGKEVRLRCFLDSKSKPAILRICEASHALRSGTACTYLESLNHQVISPGTVTEINFQCPGARDSREPGGLYALYQAAAHEGDKTSGLHCN
jgi:hypothetical protein